MRGAFFYVVIAIFTFTILLIMFELLKVQLKQRSLQKGMIDLSENTFSYELAERDKKKYIESQLKATTKRTFTLLKDLSEQCLYFLLALLFMLPVLQHALFKISEKRLNFMSSSISNFSRSEITATNIFITMYLFVSLIFSDIYESKIELCKLIVLLIICYLFVFPYLIIMALYIFSKLGIQLILACYLAYFLKTIPDILTVDELEATMKNMPARKLPSKVQEILDFYDMSESVYNEKDPSTNMNAALVGYGSKMRIEIYGDMNKLDKRKVLSIFLHELGHAYESSLFKKASFYFLFVGVECLFLIFLYKKMAVEFGNQKMDKGVSFICLGLIYKMGMRQWLFMMYKAVSQHSEIVSDYFAMAYGYGPDLATTLFEIGLDSADYLNPNPIYNLLRSGHPSIVHRVEYLMNK